MISKPMLSGTLENPSKLKFPTIASPKLDGIRCVKVNGKALTRKFKPVPNHYIRNWIEANLPDGIDGEIMIRNATFNEIQSGVMSEDGEPDFVFMAFDIESNEEFEDRLNNLYAFTFNALKNPTLSKHYGMVAHHPILTMDQLNEFEAKCLAEGFEGVMVRSPTGPYKNGRSTE